MTKGKNNTTTSTHKKTSLVRRVFARFNINLPTLPSAPPAHQPSRNTILQLAALTGLAVISHFFIADIEISILALIIFSLKLAFLLSKNKSVTPPQVIIMLLTIISVGLIIKSYGGWNEQRAGISFLVLLASLKFLESRTLRDYYIVCLILYFLGASSFLFNSSIPNIVIVMLYTLMITGIMLKLSSPNPVNWRSSISSASGIITRGIPIALLLFFFFPRIHGSFGFIPSINEPVIDNSLVAGDIANSAFNNSLAFRVEFEGATPLNQQLYWRSKVMTQEEEFAWVVREPSPTEINSAKEKASLLKKIEPRNLTHYTILHQSTADIFLPYLDYVANYSKGKFTDSYSIWTGRPNNGAFSYQGASLVSNAVNEPNQLNSPRLLETTSQPSARAQVLLTKWRNLSSDPQELVDIVYQHFLENEFSYSLFPPELNEFDRIDDFLFNSQTGYCEHYASAFTILMRWLGIPSRVVLGYQGGRSNQSGDYLEVRYSDAHAWSEVLIDQQWIRVDPTAAISPERIEYGMDAFMSAWDPSTNSNSSLGLSNYLNPTGMDRYYRKIRDTWNNAGYQWNKWVVNYDSETQGELLNKLGFNNDKKYLSLALIMLISVGTLMAFYFWRLLPKRVKRSEAQQLYLKFLAAFKKYELDKKAHETPNEFSHRAREKFPQNESEITKITNTYIQIRYGKSPPDLDNFRQLVKKFKLNN